MDERRENPFEKNTDQENQGYYDSRQSQTGGGIQPSYEEEPRGKNGAGFAIASLILGIVSLVLFCTFINIPLAILSIVFGALAISRNTRKGMAIVGLVTSIISIILLIIVFAAGFSLASQMMTPGSDWNDFYQEFQREVIEEYADL